MNYIFYDIECANCQYGQAKICSFGYVVASEDFEVLESRQTGGVLDGFALVIDRRPDQTGAGNGDLGTGRDLGPQCV